MSSFYITVGVDGFRHTRKLGNGDQPEVGFRVCSIITGGRIRTNEAVLKIRRNLDPFC